MDSSYLGQVKRALGFEEILEATLISITREQGKANFSYKHNDTGMVWRTTLTKLEKYGHNKFSKYNKGTTVGKYKTQEEVLLKFVQVHDNTYDYSNVVYINNITKVEIICKTHGSFWQRPSDHKMGKGCRKCSYANKKTLIEVLRDFTEVHNNKYDYSNVVYINSKTKVDIICPKHGRFSQSPNSHLRGQGCPTCANVIHKKCAQSNATGWTHTAWEKAGNASKHFESFKVYVIRCYNEEESFFKIGKTFNTLESRLANNTSKLPYTYKVLKVIEGEAKEISKLEHKLHKLNKEYKYLPAKEFGGRFECFSELKEELFADSK